MSMTTRASVALPALAGVCLGLAAGCQPETEERHIPHAEADLRLALDLPSRLRPGEAAEIRVDVENRSDETTGDFEVHLVVPGWLRPSDPAEIDGLDGMHRGEHGVRLWFRIPRAGLEGGGQWRADVPVERVEVEEDAPAMVGAVVRAWIADRDGTVIGSAVEARVPGAPRPDVLLEREGVGPARLGAEIDLLREHVPTARDTTVRVGGERYDALLVPISERASVHVLASEGLVVGVVVRDPRLRTPSGVGVGTPLSRLLKVYGDGCLRGEDGSPVAWFPSGRRFQFRLDGVPSVPQEAVLIDPRTVPADAVVDEIRIRRDDAPCPPVPDTPTPSE